MKLRNKETNQVYLVNTEDDGYGGFMIYARAYSPDVDSFCMHYRTLKEFTDEWQDVD